VVPAAALRDEPQNLLEHLPCDGDLGHLEDDIAAVAHDFRADLDQLVLQACQYVRTMYASHALHFACVDFRSDDRVFGIKDEDRFLHVYIIGKTGTGKSTRIETIALQDLERGNGFALIDPNGDLVARVAARIPTSYRDKVIYLDATDPTQPYGYNPLRHARGQCRSLIKAA
jgi:hypothetical protein